MARYELGKYAAAKEDMEETLKELPDASSNKEAQDLKQKIEQQLQKAAPSKAKTASPVAAKAVSKHFPATQR